MKHAPQPKPPRRMPRWPSYLFCFGAGVYVVAFMPLGFFPPGFLVISAVIIVLVAGAYRQGFIDARERDEETEVYERVAPRCLCGSIAEDNGAWCTSCSWHRRERGELWDPVHEVYVSIRNFGRTVKATCSDCDWSLLPAPDHEVLPLADEHVEGTGGHRVVISDAKDDDQ